MREKRVQSGRINSLQVMNVLEESLSYVGNTAKKKKLLGQVSLKIFKDPHISREEVMLLMRSFLRNF